MIFPITQNNSVKICENCVLAEASFFVDVFSFVVLWLNLRQPLVLDEFSFCKHLFFYSFEMSSQYFDKIKNLIVSMKLFKVLFYPLVKCYFAASYQDNLLPSILAVCINIFLLP